MYLGIDVGTQSVRALIYDDQSRRVVAEQSAPLDLLSGADGAREQLAGWWLTALGRCLAALPTRARQGIRAVGVSGQQHGFVALDAAGEVLAPVKLWCDTATVPECESITAAFGGRQRCIDEVGNPVLPGYTAPKIRWLKNHQPAQYAQLATVLLPHDYVNFCLTGERSMECGDASGTGLLDIRHRRWHSGIIEALDPDHDLLSALPALAAPGSAIGQVTAKAAADYGLPAGIPVATGGGDNMMAAVGTGNVTAGTLTVSLGTSGTLFASADAPVIDPRGELAAFCSSTGAWLPLLCTMNCTVSTELTRNLFALDLAELDRRVAAVAPGANGVVTLPFFNGERSPELPAGKACVCGLDGDNYRPDNLLRSAMEAPVYGLRAGLEAMRAQGCVVNDLRLTGGGAGSATWRQMVSDIFDLPVSVQVLDEGAALGAALLALWTVEGGALRGITDTHIDIDPARACQPQPEAAGRYRELYNDYLRHVNVARALYA